jgi:hypothetical protein
MSAVAVPPRPVERPASLFDPVGGGPTLGDAVAGAWEGLAAHAVVVCPVCTGRMSPRYGSGAAVLGGRCQSCGSALS